MIRKRIYCAGRMSGMPGLNFDSFDSTRDYLVAKGHEVVSPADITRRIWKNKYGTEFDPNGDHSGQYGDYLLADLTELATCDAIYLMPGWEKSKGVAAELAFAKCLGLEVIDPTPEPSVLEEAATIVNGDRQTHYGHPLDNHGCTASLWSAWLNRRYGATLELTAEDVCWLMILLKASREANAPKRDNVVDTVGYAANIDMIRTERKRRAS